MNHVRGPFIGYDCHVCRSRVQESAPTNHDALVARLVALNATETERRCASCAPGFGDRGPIKGTWS